MQELLSACGLCSNVTGICSKRGEGGLCAHCGAPGKAENPIQLVAYGDAESHVHRGCVDAWATTAGGQ